MSHRVPAAPRFAALALSLIAAGCGEDETHPAPLQQPEPPPCEEARPDAAGFVSRSCLSVLESEPHIATSTTGTVAMAWIGIDYARSHIGVTTSADPVGEAGEWTPITPIFAPDERTASDPVLVAEADGSFRVTFIGFVRNAQGVPEKMRLYVAHVGADGVPLGEPVDISPALATTLLDKPWIARTASGTLLVSYAYATAERSGLGLARSLDGSKWEHVTVVEGALADVFRNLTYLCVAGERVHVPFYEVRSLGGALTYSIELRTSDDDGLTFPDSLATQVSAGDEDDAAFSMPTCATRGDDVLVSYGLSQETIGGEEGLSSLPLLHDLRLAVSNDGGASIAERRSVLDPNDEPLALLPHLAAAADGTIALTYFTGKASGDTAGTARLRLGAFVAGGSPTLGPPSAVRAPLTFTGARTETTWLGDYTGLAFRDRDLVGALTDNGDGTSHVALLRVPR
jgi:hypothetical protein